MLSLNKKKCPKCGLWKPHEEFYKDSSRNDGLGALCKPCKSASEKLARKDNPERTKQKRHRNHLRELYGISETEYARMFAEQNGQCKMCHRPQSAFTRRLCVDHDHKTLNIRGLLCISCNTILGQAQDRIEVLEQGIIYLEKFKKLG